MLKEKKPIFALATSRGKSAIAVFRVSGKGVHKIVKKISSRKHWVFNEIKTNYLLDEEKQKIDKTITTLLKSPKTYTGEDMVEIFCHGSSAVINKVSNTLLTNNVRQAEPGEFTKRALINNKIDITQAESISDIVNSETEKQRITAMKNLDGELSDFLKSLNKNIKKMLADVEALIDFSDEDLPKNLTTKIIEQKKNIIKTIKKSISKSKLSKSIRDGFLICVLGSPNTGKSSFVNYISGRNVSIVTEIPGTTTDSLEVALEIDGYKFRFVDTAGIRKGVGKIEKIGIEKTYKNSLISDLNLVFLENNEKRKYDKITNKIFVRSKQDRRRNLNDTKIHKISSKTGFGIKKLIKTIKKEVIKTDNEKIPLFSRERHLNKINNCLKIIETININKNPDIVAEDLRLALKEVTEIYERFDIEKILDIIFSDFCIGK